MSAVSDSPVMKMTGMFAHAACAFSCRRVSNPLMPGMTASKQDGVGRHEGQAAQGLWAIPGDQHGIALPVQGIAQHPQGVWRIVNHQHGAARRAFSRLIGRLHRWQGLQVGHDAIQIKLVDQLVQLAQAVFLKAGWRALCSLTAALSLRTWPHLGPSASTPGGGRHSAPVNRSQKALPRLGAMTGTGRTKVRGSIPVGVAAPAPPRAQTRSRAWPQNPGSPMPAGFLAGFKHIGRHHDDRGVQHTGLPAMHVRFATRPCRPC